MTAPPPSSCSCLRPCLSPSPHQPDPPVAPFQAASPFLRTAISRSPLTSPLAPLLCFSSAVDPTTITPPFTVKPQQPLSFSPLSLTSFTRATTAPLPSPPHVEPSPKPSLLLQPAHHLPFHRASPYVRPPTQICSSTTLDRADLLLIRIPLTLEPPLVYDSSATASPSSTRGQAHASSLVHHHLIDNPPFLESTPFVAVVLHRPPPHTELEPRAPDVAESSSADLPCHKPIDRGKIPIPVLFRFKSYIFRTCEFTFLFVY